MQQTLFRHARANETQLSMLSWAVVRTRQSRTVQIHNFIQQLWYTIGDPILVWYESGAPHAGYNASFVSLRKTRPVGNVRLDGYSTHFISLIPFEPTWELANKCAFFMNWDLRRVWNSHVCCMYLQELCAEPETALPDWNRRTSRQIYGHGLLLLWTLSRW